jgi:UDP-glucose 4-epimerase
LMERGTVVTVLDDLSNGSLGNLSLWLKHPHFSFINGDCLSKEDIKKAIGNCGIVFHMAANPDVRVGETDTRIHLEQNVIATHNLLEEMRKSETANVIGFASTSTVYGETTVIPTPEDYGPLKPISLYGASKLASEAFISAYCGTFDMKGAVYRLANIVGPRSRHGVIWDFIQKLVANPQELEILGDGTQTKAYLFIDDCIDAMLLGLEKAQEDFQVFNVGPEDQVNIRTIAKIVTDSMKLRDVKFRHHIAAEGGRGWKGDVKIMLLDILKLKKLGWEPKHSSFESVAEASRQILREIGYCKR